MKITIEKINQIIKVVIIRPLVFSQCFSLFDIFYPPYRLKERTITISIGIGSPKMVFEMAKNLEKTIYGN